MNECGSRLELGAFVLGGLATDEVEEVEAHLARCPSCRRELVELEDLPAVLALAADSSPAPPQRVRDRVLADAGVRRVRRHWIAVAAAVAVVAAMLGGVVTARLLPVRTDVVVGLRAVEPFETSGWALIRETRGGVTLELEMSGLEPLPAGAVYEAWLSTHGEQLVSLGVLRPDGAGSVAVELQADGPLPRYRSFWVTAEPDTTSSHDGPTVVYARLPPPGR